MQKQYKPKGNGTHMSKDTTKIKSLQIRNPNAAGIDIGCSSHFVAVPPHTCAQPVRKFSSFTCDLHQIVTWLKECGVETVAMESTGVYWIPLYEILEANGFEVYLVNAQHVKNLPGRKTDVKDCQWLQELHTFGLLQKSFRPTDRILEIRAYMRQRGTLIQDSASFVQRMHKALTLMNVQINNVIRDITGVTGMKILRAIVAGTRDPKQLAAHRDVKCKEPLEVFESSLEGNYREEHVFALKQAIEMYDFYNGQIRQCELEIEKRLNKLESRVVDATATEDTTQKPARRNTRSKTRKLRKHDFSFDVECCLKRITGVDVTAIPGVGEAAGLMMISEIGTDLHHWKNAKHFASWLGLCPRNKISGGRILQSRTRPGAKRIAWILRVCAGTLSRSKTALGAHLRRLKSRIGAPKAITAIAHKLAKMLYNMLRYGNSYVEVGQEEYEKRYKERRLKGLIRAAREMGLKIQPMDSAP